MALDFNKLKKFQKKVESGGDGDEVFYANKIQSGGGKLIRILPPLANLDGAYYFESIGCFINGKPYTSPKTFGRPCPIEEELAIALKSGDPDVQELAEGISLKSSFDVPVLLFADVDDEEPEKAGILNCGKQLITAINKIVIHRNYQPDITDRVNGFNIECQKTGKGFDTKYSAMGDLQPSEMDAKYYDEKAIPDVYTRVQRMLKHDDYLRAVIRNHLYGEAIPDGLSDKKAPENAHGGDAFLQGDVDKKDATKKETPKQDPPQRQTRRRAVPDEEEVEEPAADVNEVEVNEPETVTAEKETPAAPKKGGRRSRLIDDLD